MIRDFADANGGLSIVAEYSDDGFSGSAFENRPGWGSLLADVEAGKVDCIVVKDLSRLGRNYLDVSRYLDQVFPALGVRVVAITDGYDSAAEKTPADALMLPVKNLFNDMYCRDASAKTKASLSAKRRRGEFVGAFAPYGYVKGSGWNKERNGDLKPADVIANSNKRVWWKCKEGHEWSGLIVNRARKGKADPGCPYCSGRKALAGYNDLATTHPDMAAMWHPRMNKRLKPTGVQAISRKLVWWRGDCGHVYQMAVRDRVRAKPGYCPYCSGRKRPERPIRLD